ncbi:MAG: tRNA uridine-5-carboxymethylaminomethyl(34) synthesis GTPase MnmE [Candidatus Riflebacteria bacterium]|nr:tRNA uridine-5-carboxymethylaminomethyl(34) synthesis GTPase MnmE [Candidatus Riflebacteria bacterium]
MTTAKIDTIAAVSTPPGRSAIGVIRISGPETFSILKKVFSPAGKREFPASFFAYPGFIHAPDDRKKLDQVVVTTYPSPRSFTGEDVAEIATHGNPVVMTAVLAALYKSGASRAQPGEFIRRAFLNGKVDLLEVEATAQILASQTISQAQIALEQLSGLPCEKIRDIRTSLFQHLAQLEASLSFPEDSIEDLDYVSFKNDCESILKKMQNILNCARQGSAISKGLPIVLLGRPNTGKSSLLNCILGRERAIVTPHAGTTRDTIEEQFAVGDYPVRFIDTAGLRSPTDQIEEIGIQKTKDAMNQAFLVLGIFDVSAPLTKEDYDVINEIRNSAKPSVIVFNKCDLLYTLQESDTELFSGFPSVNISALSGSGIDELLKHIEQKIKDSGMENLEEMIYLGAHQISSLEAAIEALKRTIAGSGTIFPDMLAVELGDTIKHLGSVTGDTFDINMLDRIFETFCIGK